MQKIKKYYKYMLAGLVAIFAIFFVSRTKLRSIEDDGGVARIDDLRKETMASAVESFEESEKSVGEAAEIAAESSAHAEAEVEKTKGLSDEEFIEFINRSGE